MEIEGDGFATRDWIFVEETCLALYKLAFVKLDNFEVINIASQTPAPAICPLPHKEAALVGIQPQIPRNE